MKRLVSCLKLPSIRIKPPSPRTLLTLFATLILASMISVTSLVATASAADTVWTGVDFAWHGKLDPKAFKKAGVDFVVRYIAGGTSKRKEINHYEADMWSKAGVGIVLVWETTASRAGQGYDAGYRDASIAFPQAKSMGMPDGKPIYFAVDYDADPRAVEPYFKGIFDWARTHFADGQATSRIGVYGGHDVVKHIRNGGYAKYGWQASAWMKGKGRLPGVMQQHGINKTVAGVSVDWNRVSGSDYGVWFSTCVINPPKRTPNNPKELGGPADKADSQGAKGKPGDSEKAEQSGQLTPQTRANSGSTTTSISATSLGGPATPGNGTMPATAAAPSGATVPSGVPTSVGVATTDSQPGTTSAVTPATVVTTSNAPSAMGSSNSSTRTESGVQSTVGTTGKVFLLRQARALGLPLELLLQVRASS